MGVLCYSVCKAIVLDPWTKSLRLTMVGPGVGAGGQSGLAMLIPVVSDSLAGNRALVNMHDGVFQDRLCGELQQSPGMYAGVNSPDSRMARKVSAWDRQSPLWIRRCTLTRWIYGGLAPVLQRQRG